MKIIHTDAFGNEQTLQGASMVGSVGDASTSFADQQLRLECFKAIKSGGFPIEQAEKLYQFVKHGKRAE